MKTKHFFLSTLLLLAVCCNFIACSKDDDGYNGDDDLEYIEDEVDQLVYLQHSLAPIDEDGNFQYRSLGVSLNPADTTVVSVGVNDLAEAKEIFSCLFSIQTEVSSDGMRYTLGDGKGTVELVAETGEGKVAVAYFDVPQLKHISQIIFIENSAWPANAEIVGIRYRFGTIYEDEGFRCEKQYSSLNDYLVKYVCIKAASNGQPAILLGISRSEQQTYCHNQAYLWDVNLPREKDTETVSNILIANFDTINSSLSSAGLDPILMNTYYWMYDTHFWFWTSWYFRSTFNIKNNGF